MSRPSTIQTTSGPRVLVRRVGAAGEYYETIPTRAAPNGEWWVRNPQRGIVPIAGNSRGLQAALAGETF